MTFLHLFIFVKYVNLNILYKLPCFYSVVWQTHAVMSLFKNIINNFFHISTKVVLWAKSEL